MYRCCICILLKWTGDVETTAVDMLLEVCANISGALEMLRCTFTTRKRCIRAWPLLVGEFEARARGLHWLSFLNEILVFTICLPNN